MAYDMHGPSSMHPQSSLQQSLLQPSCYTDQLIEPSCAFLGNQWQQQHIFAEPRVRKPAAARQLEISEEVKGKAVEIGDGHITIQYRNEAKLLMPAELSKLWKNRVKPGDVVAIIRVDESNYRIRIVSDKEREGVE